ncbi:MAG: Crp/Fnr family transcriptional regulator [Spirochaetales bacterium]|nr:Crp/Fnr family transcriptional regulator [Spirochaetales bacterium]
MASIDELISGSPLEDYFNEEIKDRVRIGSYVEGSRIRLPDGVLFLMDGTVSFTYSDREGIPYQVVIARSFNSIGELHYYHDRVISDIFALEDSTLLEVPLNVFRKLEENRDFLIFMLRKVNENLLSLADKMARRNTYKLENYLAYIILTDQLKGRYYYKSMTALAAVFNVSRRNLYYAADSLIDQKLIGKGKGYFEILNEPALREMI